MSRGFAYRAMAILAISALLAWHAPSPVAAQPEIRVTLNGRALPCDPGARVVSGSAMIPFGCLATALGAQVRFDPATRMASATLGDRSVRMWAGRRYAVVSGRVVSLPVPPLMAGGAMLVPAKVLAEGLGARVSWDRGLVAITYSPAAKQDIARPPAAGQGTGEQRLARALPRLDTAVDISSIPLGARKEDVLAAWGEPFRQVRDGIYGLEWWSFKPSDKAYVKAGFRNGRLSVVYMLGDVWTYRAMDRNTVT